VLGQVEPAGQRDQLARNRRWLLGGNPPGQVVVAGVAVGVLDGQLGLANPAQPAQRLRLGLDDRGGLAGVQALVELVEQLGAAGEGGIAWRQVGHQRPRTGWGELVEDGGRWWGWQVDVDLAGAADGDQLADPGVPGDLGHQGSGGRVLLGLVEQAGKLRPQLAVPAH
jgi:hypothetical protein